MLYSYRLVEDECLRIIFDFFELLEVKESVRLVPPHKQINSKLIFYFHHFISH